MPVKRNTFQKSLVLKTVHDMKCHVSADEVYDVINKNYPNISRATVYRNLNELAKSKEIKKIEIPGGADRFDYKCFDHYHIRCLKCGKIFDVDMEYIKDLEKTIQNSHGFEFKGHDIMFKGICPICR
ncbi:MAG: transcriptional repressor [Candidatus Gastranaerophilales bacterium]|nr:transcriptional repressor [Candidatus Gastranaerophilales bacterium]